MARRRRELLPPPPANGGYEFEVVQVGPPIYTGPLPVPVAKGKLIPMGDGEGFPPLPAPPTGRRPSAAAKRRRAALASDAVLELGLTRQAMGDLATAVVLFERAVDRARRANDRRRTATTLRALALAHGDADRLDAAVLLAAEAVAIAGEVGSRSFLSRALIDHGGLLRRAGRLTEAAAVLERAVETAGA